jgi:hypothetical protein
MSHDWCRKYTSEQRVDVVRRRQNGESVTAISAVTGVGHGSVRAILSAAGVHLPDGLAGKDKRKLTDEQEEEMIRLRRDDHVELKALATRFGVSLFTVKAKLSAAAVQIPREVAVAHAAEAIRRIPPDERARQDALKHTPESDAKRSATSKKTWADSSRLRAMKSKKSKEFWATISEEERNRISRLQKDIARSTSDFLPEVGFDGRRFLTKPEWEAYCRHRPAHRTSRRSLHVEVCYVCGETASVERPFQFAHRIGFLQGILLFGLTPDYVDRQENLVTAHRGACNDAAELTLEEVVKVLRADGVETLPDHLLGRIKLLWDEIIQQAA